MKISIRLSILSLVLALLLGVSFLIIHVVNKLVIDILFSTTERSLSLASEKVDEQINNYIAPLNHAIYIGYNVINDNTITPGNSPTFINFLYRVVSAFSAITSIYWGDEAGNFYLVKQTYDKKVINENIIKTPEGSKEIENIYDNHWHLIKSTEAPYLGLDPNTRPWYQLAKFRQKPDFLIYPMYKVGSQEAELGITSVTPLYDTSHQLRGVFAVDLPLKPLSTFVKNIKITPNSVVFICDDQSHILTAYSSGTNLLQGYKMPKLADLKIPIAEESFSQYQKTKKPLFYFTLDNKKYVTIYKQISQTINETKWQVAIVTPVQDITAPLEHSFFIRNLFVIISLIGGTILATIFSSSLSKPIRQLAKSSELICELKLSEVKQISSHIKEISLMADAFNKMKNALASFQRYMPIALVKQLLLAGTTAEVGGEMRELTVLFSDIENFTPLSETMPAEDIMRYLSEYFQVATKIILQTKGTVDKYIGDGMMAFWGAPLEDPKHALHTCQAALQLQAAFHALNIKWHNENKPEVATRLGINTGPVIVGNVGSDDRLNYTSLGNSVDLASRLENLNKVYGTYIMVGETTYNLTKDSFRFRLLDKVAVKGKKQGTYIYELLGPKATDDINAQQDIYNQKFHTAFSKYEQGDWHTAIDLFNNLAQQYPQDHLINIFVERCNSFIKNAPLAWEGTWVMRKK